MFAATETGWRIAESLRADAARHLIPFTLWTFRKYRFAAHLNALAEALEAVDRGEIKRLIVVMPPRHGKSELVSVRFPAWWLGRHPDKRFVLVCYAADLAERHSRMVRACVQSPAYRQVFDGMSIDQTSRSAQQWDLAGRRGGMKAVGVGGPLTGFGADCLAGNTLIKTECGLRTIREITRAGSPVMVLTCNHKTGTLEYRLARPHKPRLTLVLYTITLANGTKVQATKEHPFFVAGRGYVRASSLEIGDEVYLYSVRRCVSRQTEQKQKVLHPAVLRRSAARGCASAHVRPLRAHLYRSAARPRCSCRTSFLLLGMLRDSRKPKARSEMSHLRRASASRLHLLQSAVFGHSQTQSQATLQNVWPPMHSRTSLLQPSLCGQSSFARRCGRKERQVSTRTRERALQNGVSFADPACRDRTRPSLSALRRGQSSHGSPYQRDKTGRSAGQSPASVPAVPYAIAQIEKSHLAAPEEVYNLSVEGNENFFANGVLVHNCLLVDDPIKNRQDADSETVRNAVWDWWTSTAYTRLEDNAAIVVVNTRWHEDDLTGRLLAAQGTDPRADQWHIVHFPAISDAGEALWPEKYPLEELERIRANTGPYDWEALYQGRPAAPEGAMFKRAWFQIIDEPPQGLTWVRGWDLAASSKETADYTAGARCALDADGNLFISHIERRRQEWPETIKDMAFLASMGDRGCRWGVETQGFQLSAVQQLLSDNRFSGVAIQSVRADRDKVSRAAAWQSRAAAGKVFLIRGEWNQAFVAEACGFPVGKHDDQIDAVSIAWELLTDGFIQPRVYSAEDFDEDE